MYFKCCYELVALTGLIDILTELGNLLHIMGHLRFLVFPPYTSCFKHQNGYSHYKQRSFLRFSVSEYRNSWLYVDFQRASLLCFPA